MGALLILLDDLRERPFICVNWLVLVKRKTDYYTSISHVINRCGMVNIMNRCDIGGMHVLT